MEKINEEIEAKKESLGIVSYEIVESSLHLKVKSGYQSRGSVFIAELSYKYEGLIKGGNTQVE